LALRSFKVTRSSMVTSELGHAAMEVFLVLNGFEMNESVDEQERVILSVASGAMSRDEFTTWLAVRVHSTE